MQNAISGLGACLTVPLGAEVDEAAVEAAVRVAFREQRAFAFAPRAAWHGGDAGERRRLAVAVRGEAVAAVAPDSPAARERLQRDARLMQRLGEAVRLTHDLLMADEGGGRTASVPRRVVLIRELPGTGFLFEQGEAAVLARVGQGPVGARVPTIYLGLRLFDRVTAEQDTGAGGAREALGLVLRLEERAIKTGYSHVEALDARQRAALDTLYRALREPARGFSPPDQELPPPRRPMRVTAARRQAFLRQLNARRADSPLDFDAAICTAAMRSLERLAQRAKRHGDAGTPPRANCCAIPSTGCWRPVPATRSRPPSPTGRWRTPRRAATGCCGFSMRPCCRCTTRPPTKRSPSG